MMLKGDEMSRSGGMADAPDSKSGPCNGGVGSSPTFGTKDLRRIGGGVPNPVVQFWYTSERDIGVALPFPEGHPWPPCKSATAASASCSATTASVNPSR